VERLFFFEFITCGGLCDKQMMSSLSFDAELMYQAVLSDLRRIENLEIITCRDERLTQVAESVARVGKTDNVWQIWKSCMELADMVWIIAPETDGILIRLNQLAIDCGCKIIGCDIDTLKLTTSKYQTNRYLIEHGISAVESIKFNNEALQGEGPWVVKRDDGAGSEECHVFNEKARYEDWRDKTDNKHNYILQSYLSGIPASMSILCRRGETVLLSCNRQRVKITDDRIITEKIDVNVLHKYHEPLKVLATDIASVIPGLRGYIGVDIVLTDTGPVVLEINPRITASYAGLSISLNQNVAEMILNACQIPARSHLGNSDYSADAQVVC
jgi:tyramine---L-glutamate ligase